MILPLAYPPPPYAPVDSTVSAADSTVALAALSIVAVFGLGWAVKDGARNRDVRFIGVFLGGLATSLLEPFADLLGLVWFPVDDQVHAFTMLGIPIPLFVVIGYTNLFGLLPWIFLRMIERTPNRRRYWTVSASMLLAACVFEWLLLRTGAYLYYGNQPLNVWGYPMIWMTINTGACLLAALLLHRFRDHLSGVRALAAIAVVPCCDGAVMLGTGWPGFAAIHSDLPRSVVNPLGLLTIALGMGIYLVGAELSCRGGRLRASSVADVEPGVRTAQEARA